MEYRELGRTGMSMSVVSFGTSPLGDMFGPTREESGIAAVHRALDAGINFFDSSPFYGMGLAEERLGKALGTHRDEVFIGTKAGRYGVDTFDYSPVRIRQSVEESLRLLGTDYLDILQFHDVEFVKMDRVFTDSFGELEALRDAGLCRFIGMTGYPMAMLQRVIRETAVDLVLSYAHSTLLDQCLGERLLPLAAEHGVGVVNASAVSLGLLTSGRPKITGIKHPADEQVIQAAGRVQQICVTHGVDISFLANQFSIQRSGTATTLIGTVNPKHMDSAIAAAETPIDEELLAEVLAATSAVSRHDWINGLPENN